MSRAAAVLASVTDNQLKYRPLQSTCPCHLGADRILARSLDKLCWHQQLSPASHTTDTMGSPVYSTNIVTTSHQPLTQQTSWVHQSTPHTPSPRVSHQPLTQLTPPVHQSTPQTPSPRVSHQPLTQPTPPVHQSTPQTPSPRVTSLSHN